MLLNLSRPFVCRFGKSELRASAPIEDDTQSGGKQNSPENGQADEEEEDTAGQFAQHVSVLS